MTGPSLDELRRGADPKLFPMHVLDGVKSAACFFCAGYLGQLDSIHICDAGVTDVFLCDLDAAKLGQMRAVYPAAWRFELGDAYRIAERQLRAGKRYDLVIADPWAGHMDRLLKTFPLWYALSRRWLLMASTRPWYESRGDEPGPESARLAIRRAHGLDVTVEPLVWRSDWLGGVYWLVVRKDDPEHGVGHAWDHSDDDTLGWRLRRNLGRLFRRPAPR